MATKKQRIPKIPDCDQQTDTVLQDVKDRNSIGYRLIEFEITAEEIVLTYEK